MRMSGPWALGSTHHGGRQEIGILGIKSSVRQRSARSSPPRRRRRRRTDSPQYPWMLVVGSSIWERYDARKSACRFCSTNTKVLPVPTNHSTSHTVNNRSYQLSCHGQHIIVNTGVFPEPTQGVYKSSLTNLQETSRKPLTKFSSSIFTLIEPSKCYNVGYKHMHFQLCTTLRIKLYKNVQITVSMV